MRAELCATLPFDRDAGWCAGRVRTYCPLLFSDIITPCIHKLLDISSPQAVTYNRGYFHRAMGVARGYAPSLQAPQPCTQGGSHVTEEETHDNRKEI
jgi:hypothetical protein